MADRKDNNRDADNGDIYYTYCFMCDDSTAHDDYGCIDCIGALNDSDT